MPVAICTGFLDDVYSAVHASYLSSSTEYYPYAFREIA